jgi:cellulose synthase/poly-beta-1,6-N-acetylglucosamine synthase-like glycosyltransferase
LTNISENRYNVAVCNTTTVDQRYEKVSTAVIVGQACSYVALTFGILFFIFACKYYFAILIALFSGRTTGGNGNGRKGYKLNNVWRNEDSTIFNPQKNGNGENNLFNVTNDRKQKQDEPFVSIQLPFYNEKNVARRIIQACSEIDYPNFEVVIADDSRDETIDILKEFSGRRDGPMIKIVHRKDRTGFKGGALQKALDFMDPRTEYVVVLDADFIPPPDILRRFLWYFEGQNGNDSHENGNNHRLADQVLSHYENGDNEDLYERVDEWFERRRIGVVQGYQLHYLNKNENWITKGVRVEYSGGYMVERVAEEFFGALKMITGSVFMIRADVLRKLGWTHSITEDWDLTLRMYLEGYKVLYTPLIQAPAEIPTTIRALARQRMRWAEGHTFAVKKYFWDVLRSHDLTGREKLEFLYFAPYYLQSFFFLIGTFFWIAAEFLSQHPFFWTATFGWCLILSNLFALPLMGISGLYLEQTAREDFTGVFSLIILSYLLTPFQAYAAVKGLLEGDEGGWVRTLKTGSITDRILQIRLRRLFSWVLPRREPRRVQREEARQRRRRPSAMVLIFLILMSSIIVWVTAAAMSIPLNGATSTALSFEYVEPAITVNTITSNRVMTHADYTDLGKEHHTDAYTISTTSWRLGWSFHLYGSLERDYKMNGRLVFILPLRSDKEADVDIRIRVREIDENGITKGMVNEEWKEIELEREPEDPIILEGKPVHSKKFSVGSSLLVEIWFKGDPKDEITCYFDYDSEEKHSRVELPGIVMPESLLPVMLIAPVIPVIIWKMKERKEDKDDE